MIDKVTKALEAKHGPATLDSMGIKIPSQGYVGMQFAPKNKNTTKALAYTGTCCVDNVVTFVVVVAIAGIGVDGVDVIIAYTRVFARDDDDAIVFFVATTAVAVVATTATIVASSSLA
jgi:hypothetical protein